tara:strand:+ start:1013 stop:1186 length:174 start_codon:yes stop_codon:yes gene_type:complete
LGFYPLLSPTRLQTGIKQLADMMPFPLTTRYQASIGIAYDACEFDPLITDAVFLFMH